MRGFFADNGDRGRCCANYNLHKCAADEQAAAYGNTSFNADLDAYASTDSNASADYRRDAICVNSDESY